MSYRPFAERDETLYAYALIARAAVETNISFLMKLFSERCALLSQVVSFPKPFNVSFLINQH